MRVNGVAGFFAAGDSAWSLFDGRNVSVM